MGEVVQCGAWAVFAGVAEGVGFTSYSITIYDHEINHKSIKLSHSDSKLPFSMPI